MSMQADQQSRLLGRKLGQIVGAREKEQAAGRGWTPRTMSWDDREN